MTEEELADEIHRLSDELHKRSYNVIEGESWLNRQLRIASLEVRSWPSHKQQAMKDIIR